MKETDCRNNISKSKVDTSFDSTEDNKTKSTEAVLKIRDGIEFNYAPYAELSISNLYGISKIIPTEDTVKLANGHFTDKRPADITGNTNAKVTVQNGEKRGGVYLFVHNYAQSIAAVKHLNQKARESNTLEAYCLARRCDVSSDGIVIIDLDNCESKISRAYYGGTGIVERSSSGTGYHITVKVSGKLRDALEQIQHNKKNKIKSSTTSGYELEITLGLGNYVALTGDIIQYDSIELSQSCDLYADILRIAQSCSVAEAEAVSAPQLNSTVSTQLLTKTELSNRSIQNVTAHGAIDSNNISDEWRLIRDILSSIDQNAIMRKYPRTGEGTKDNNGKESEAFQSITNLIARALVLRGIEPTEYIVCRIWQQSDVYKKYYQEPKHEYNESKVTATIKTAIEYAKTCKLQDIYQIDEDRYMIIDPSTANPVEVYDGTEAPFIRWCRKYLGIGSNKKEALEQAKQIWFEIQTIKIIKGIPQVDIKKPITAIRCLDGYISLKDGNRCEAPKEFEYCPFTLHLTVEEAERKPTYQNRGILFTELDKYLGKATRCSLISVIAASIREKNPATARVFVLSGMARSMKTTIGVLCSRLGLAPPENVAFGSEISKCRFTSNLPRYIPLYPLLFINDPDAMDSMFVKRFCDVVQEYEQKGKDHKSVYQRATVVITLNPDSESFNTTAMESKIVFMTSQQSYCGSERKDIIDVFCEDGSLIDLWQAILTEGIATGWNYRLKDETKEQNKAIQSCTIPDQIWLKNCKNSLIDGGTGCFETSENIYTNYLCYRNRDSDCEYADILEIVEEHSTTALWKPSAVGLAGMQKSQLLNILPKLGYTKSRKEKRGFYIQLPTELEDDVDVDEIIDLQQSMSESDEPHGLCSRCDKDVLTKDTKVIDGKTVCKDCFTGVNNTPPIEHLPIAEIMKQCKQSTTLKRNKTMHLKKKMNKKKTGC